MIGILPSVGFGHDPGLSTAQVELRSEGIIIVGGFAPADIQELLPAASPRAEKWEHSHFELVEPDLMVLAPSLWEVRVGATTLTAELEKVHLLPGDNVSFTLRFPRPAGTDPITLRAQQIPRLPSGHRQFVIVTDARGSAVAKKLLSAKDNVLEVPLVVTALASNRPSPPTTETFWRFVALGIEHIWTGYDHLLFLFALLVVCRSVRSIIAIITCFTLAHSLTLAVATLGVVSLPARWVEASIAASIIFVGVENLCRRGQEPHGRLALTFAFGLVHGFGFASVLRDLGVGGNGSGIFMPLFTFNLGVELGQIAIAIVVLPVVWQLRKKPAFLRYGVPGLPLGVAVAGLYWLLERTAFA